MNAAAVAAFARLGELEGVPLPGGAVTRG